MANKLFDQVSGIIIVNLKGKNQEKVINMALSRGIYLWDIKKDGDTMNFKVRSSGYQALKSIAEEHNYEISVINRQGLPVYRNLLKRRMGFLGGALIFVMALYLMSSFIWFIDVSGNKKVSKQRILVTAARHGVYEGAAKWNFSRTAVEDAILRDIDEFSYVQLDIQGVKANIKVVEKILPNNEITGPCHMVATRDGVVEDVLVLEGQANVKPGDVVGKGDILISGVILPSSDYQENVETETEPEPEPEYYLVRARGTVKARVWYDGYGECKLKTEKTFLTGKKNKILYLETPWKNINILSRREGNLPLCTIKKSSKTIDTKIGQFGIYMLTVQEQSVKVTEYTEPQAIEIARKRAMQKLNKKLTSSKKVVDSKLDILSSPSDSILRIKVSVETIEDIAIAQTINESENSN